MECGVAQILRILRTQRPGIRKNIQKILIGIADPKAGFWSKPVQTAKPANGRVEAWIVQNLWSPSGLFGRIDGLPLMTIPLP